MCIASVFTTASRVRRHIVSMLHARRRCVRRYGSAARRSRVHVGLGAARGGETHEVRVGAAPHPACYAINC